MIFYTMRCFFLLLFFFGSVYIISGRNNVSIFYFSILSGGIVNLVGIFGMSKFKVLSSFQKLPEKKN